MQAVILAAGLGTRMRELCHDCPKPMVRILGKPLLEWRLETLPSDIDEVILVVGYLQEQIREYFGTEWQGKKIIYVTQEVLNGSGGAVQLVEPYVKGSLLVTMGDDLYHPLDLQEFLMVPENEGAIGGLYVDNAQPFGLLGTDPDGKLVSVIERPHDHETGDVCVGAYVLPREFFSYPLVQITEKEFGLPQTVVVMAKEVPTAVKKVRAWQPVGSPEDIPKAEAFIQKYFM